MSKEKQEKRSQALRDEVLKYTKEELETKCNQYFSQCNDDGKKYTKPGLILYLDVAESTFHLWVSNDKGKYGEASSVLKRAMLRMQDDLEQRNDTMSLFRLKQPCYGGYADRPREESGGEVKILVCFGKSGERMASNYGK